MSSWVIRLSLGVALLVMSGLAAPVVRADGPAPDAAPVSGDFEAVVTRADQAPARLLAGTSVEERGLGYLPSPVDYTYLQGQQIPAVEATGFQPVRTFLATQYDLRQQGKRRAELERIELHVDLPGLAGTYRFPGTHCPGRLS